jgi:hypothetical protein
MRIMDMKLTLPDEVAEKLGGEPEREVLEGVVLLLVGEDRLSLEKAGEILGFENGEGAERWYAERSRSGSERDHRGSAREDPILSLGEDPVDDDVTDASVNHDRYLYGG